MQKKKANKAVKVEDLVPNFIDNGRIVYDAKVEDRYIFVQGADVTDVSV